MFVGSGRRGLRNKSSDVFFEQPTARSSRRNLPCQKLVVSKHSLSGGHDASGGEDRECGGEAVPAGPDGEDDVEDGPDGELRELEIFRRSVPWGTVTAQGLYFVAFSADPTRFHRMLARMFGTTPDGLHDRLTDFSRPVSGGYYFVPSLEALSGLGR